MIIKNYVFLSYYVVAGDKLQVLAPMFPFVQLYSQKFTSFAIKLWFELFVCINLPAMRVRIDVWLVTYLLRRLHVLFAIIIYISTHYVGPIVLNKSLTWYDSFF
jgi:hypothetical protein